MAEIASKTTKKMPLKSLKIPPHDELKLITDPSEGLFKRLISRKATRRSLLPIPRMFQKIIFIEGAEVDHENGFDNLP